MKVSSIQSFNSYNNSISKNSAAMSLQNQKYAFRNNSLINQNVSDTVSFTGLLPFHKTTPAIQKTVSELPVSKTLQKQTANLLGNLETFVKKGKVWITKNIPTNATDNEKNAIKAALSLMDFNKLKNASTENFFKKVGQVAEYTKKITPKEFENINPVFDKIADLTNEASKGSLSDMDALIKFDNILVSLDKFCETQSGTDAVFLRISCELLKAVSDITKKQVLSQADVLSVEEKTKIFKACTGFLKDTKDLIAQSPKCEEITQVLKEISNTKIK